MGGQLEYFGLWVWARKGALVNTRGTYDTPLSRRKKVGFSEQSSSEEGDAEKGLWVHKRLVHEDIDHISYTLLSVLPVIGLSNPQLIQYHFLMCLAETVDVILLGTMDLKTGNRGLELGFRLRLQNMPSQGFVGLNRALPAFQSVNDNFPDMPSEIDALVSLMRNNEDSVFAKTGIRWRFVEQELRKKGVEKSLMAIRVFPISSRMIPDQVCSLGSCIDLGSTGR